MDADGDAASRTSITCEPQAARLEIVFRRLPSRKSARGSAHLPPENGFLTELTELTELTDSA